MTKRDYRIVKENTIGKLEEKVISMMQEGWKPQGGLVAYDGKTLNNGFFGQAMFYEEDIDL